MTSTIIESIGKKVLIETWGCQMNVADSEEMLGLLHGLQYTTTNDPQAADLILLNTCHIREKAKHKVLSRLGKLRELKEANPALKIVVAGCVAQAEGEKLLKAAPSIDILLGPGKIKELPRLLQEHKPGSGSLVARGFDRDQEGSAEKIPPQAKPWLGDRPEVSRFVNIQQGCNNFCTFCVVPFTRGREVSRSHAAILGEVRQLLAQGAREITLLGQNVNSYGLDLVSKSESSDSSPFATLLRLILGETELGRLRFTTSNPHDLTRDLVNLYAEDKRMGQYLHLPVQSGSDNILERMRRKVTVAEYHERLGWLKSVCPEIAISTDLIVGFPGETEQDFEGTLSLVEAAEFSFIFSFKYSPRKGTAAMRFGDQVPEAEKDARLQRLNTVQDQITLRHNMNEIGKDREVLVLYESRKQPGVFYGRTEQFRLTRIASPSRSLVGQLVATKITDANKTALVGHLL